MELVIESVFADTVAERIGLAAGDCILSYDDHRPTSTKQFVDAASDVSGRRDSRMLVIRRNAEVFRFAIPPGRLGVLVRMAVIDPPNQANSSSSPAQPVSQSR
jgi:C-terminal processing protease CtpA/Prc